jgi:quercetin dioxygenase-like cupin family protein/ketosteroid isomerase-like protein
VEFIADRAAENEVEEFRRTILVRQAEAEEAFVHGDPGPRMELWSRRDPVTLFGAIGMSESGWDQLSQTFSWVVTRFSNVSNYRFDVSLVEVSGDIAYTLGFEHFEGSIVGRPVESVTVRVTHIYRREEGDWKIVHRHADNPGQTHVRKGQMMHEHKTRPFVRASEPEKAFDKPAPVGELNFKAHDRDTGGAMTAFESNIAPGEGPPFHLHLREDEAIYVLEGRIRVRLEEVVHEAPAGSFVFIPRGVPHTWQNVDETQVRLLVVFTPAAPGMERFFARAAELPDKARAEAFGRFAADAGMDVLGPPLAQSHPLVPQPARQ